MVKRLTALFLSLSLVGAAPGLPADPLAAMGVSLKLPAGWTASTMDSSPKEHAISAMFGQSNPRTGDNTLLEVDVFDRNAQTPQQVAQAAQPPHGPELHMHVDSHAQRGCNGTQDGWIIDEGNQFVSDRIFVVASATRVAVAKLLYKTPNAAMLDALADMCVGQPTAQGAAVPSMLDQLLSSMHLSAAIPDGWALMDGAGPSSGTNGLSAAIFMPSDVANNKTMDAITLTTEPLKGRTLEQYIKQNIPNASVKESHAAPACNGTQNGRLVRAVEGETDVQSMFAAANGRVASIVYSHQAGSRDNAAAVAALSTLCVK